MTSACATVDLACQEVRGRFAEQRLQRARHLQRNPGIRGELLDHRRTGLAPAAVQLAMRQEALRPASLDVGNRELRPTFDAVVTAREASLGSHLSRGGPVTALTGTAGPGVVSHSRRLP